MNKPESEEKSRTEYSARNMTVAVIAQALSILAGFCTRMVFTHTLSREYAGVNGLFSNILSVLALSELGAGAAITYALYKPIAAGDIEKQKSLMRLFRRFYRLVALVIFTGGLTVIPFMDLLMKNRPDIDHLVLIYLLYLSGAVSSYLMTHKRMLIETHQLSYICVLYQTGSLLAQYALQVVVLLTSGNFLLYISIATVCTILNNLAISRRADKLYPFLRDRDIRELPEGEAYQVIDKPSFGSVELGELLREEDRREPIGQITLVGLCTDICVISNALLVKAFLPEAEIVVDAACCAGVTPESHKTALQAMKSCQITIENDPA